MKDDGLRERDIDAAMETASESRRLASIYGQMGFKALSAHLKANAKNAERWAVKRAQQSR